MMKSHSRNLLILFCLIVFGAAIRLYNLGAYTYHVDEQFTIDLISKPFWDVFAFGLSKDCNPPLFYLIDWVSVRLLGFTAFAQRLPAAIFGVLVIPAVYLLGKEYRNETTGLLAAGVVTILGSMWYYSQFGRSYSMVTFLFVLLMVVFIRICRGEEDDPLPESYRESGRVVSTKTWLIYGALASLCVWTHLFALVPIGFMGMYLFYKYRWESVTKPLVTYLPVLAMAGTFYAIRTERGNIMQGWMGNTVQQLLQFTLLEYFTYSVALFMALIMLSLWMNRDDEITCVMVAVWVFSFIAQIIISEITPVFARYTLLLVPILVTVSVEPVMRFIESDDSTPAQKDFAMFVLSGMFISITAFQYFAGCFEGRQL
jgi:uncharacterized membrane protein